MRGRCVDVDSQLTGSIFLTWVFSYHLKTKGSTLDAGNYRHMVCHGSFRVESQSPEHVLFRVDVSCVGIKSKRMRTVQ